MDFCKKMYFRVSTKVTNAKTRLLHLPAQKTTWKKKKKKKKKYFFFFRARLVFRKRERTRIISYFAILSSSNFTFVSSRA